MTTKITADNIAANTITSAQLAPGIAATLYTAGGGITIEANGRISASAFVTITDFSVSGTDDLALDPAGGQTVVIQGSGFKSGATVQVGANVISAVTVIDSSTIQFTSEALPSGLYTLYVINTDNTVAILSPGLLYSGLPTFVTSAGSLGAYYETQAIDEVVEATEANSTITYAVTSGALPAGANLLANGTIIGNAPVEANSTTYSFTIAATDDENQTTTRSFSLTINTDVVTWASPAEGAQFDLDGGGAMANITLSANAASGSAVTYTANALPNNVSLVNGVISGTPDLEETVQTQLTATATDTSRTATRNITFVVSLGDLYFNQTTLLLNGDEETFITDASDNAFTITPAGDTRPSAFSPYNTSWSNFFDGTGDYLSTVNANTVNAMGSGNWTVEAWVYRTSSAADSFVFDTVAAGSGAVVGMRIMIDASSKLVLKHYSTAVLTSTGTVPLNQWTHIAIVKNSGTTTGYINGVADGTYADSSTYICGTSRPAIGVDGFSTVQPTFPGYISNLRAVKGIAVYTGNFTPPTAPLEVTQSAGTNIAAITGTSTSLLTCQSNRFIDNSTNDFAITRNGDVKVTAFAPFTETDTSTGSGYFDGTGDYLSLAGSADFDFGTGDFTISCWVYFNSYETSNGFFVGQNLFSSVFQFNSSGILQFYSQPASAYVVTGSTALPKNEWVHVAVTRSGNTFKVFLNGSVDGTGTNSSAAGFNSAYLLTIGAWNNLVASWTGYISNLYILKGTAIDFAATGVPTAPLEPIAGTSLLTLQNRIGYNNSQPIDESGINNVITRNGNASAGTFSPHVPTGWSAYFDGTGDYFTSSTSLFNYTTANAASQTFTIEAWVYHIQRTTPVQPYYAQSIATKGDVYMNLGINGSGNLIFHSYSGIATTITGSSVIPLNTWTHVAVVISGGTSTLYVNGVSAGSGNWGGIAAGGQNSTSFFGTPSTNASAQAFRGYISNIRVSSNARSISVPVAPFTNDATTDFLTLRGPSFTDDGAKRFAITRNGDTKITAFSPFAPHTRAPLSHSVYFDGTGDYLTTSTSEDFNLGTGDFTFECWASFDELSTSSATGDDFLTGGAIGDIDFAYVENSLRIARYGIAWDHIFAFTPNLNQWYHIAYTRSTGTLRVFVDGTLIGSAASSESHTISGTVFIGSDPDLTYRPFKGYISNLRLVKGTAVYTAAFTPPTEPLTAIANTSLLVCQSPTITDNSDNAFALTVNGNSQPTPFNPFGETVATRVEYAPASHGGSMYFDGTGDYLTVPDNAALEFGNGDFTIEGWVYLPAGSGANRSIIAKSNRNEAGGVGSFAINISNSNRLQMLFSDTAAPWDINVSGTTDISLNTWYHVAVTRSGNTFTAWLNGVSEVTASSSITLADNSEVLVIAALGYTSGTFVNFFTGYISNLRLVKGTALYTAAFVPPAAPATPIAGTTLLVNGTNAAIQDKTGRNVLETVGNARVVNGVKKFGSGAIYFDGNGDYLLMNGGENFAFGTGDFTVEFWVNITVNGVFYDSRPASTDGVYVTIGPSDFPAASGNSVALVVSGSRRITGTANIKDGAWHHVAVARNGTTTKLFVDGVQTGSNYTDTNNYLNGTSRPIIASQGYTAGTAIPTGYIDDLRITKGVARYTENFTPPTSTFRLK